MAEKFLEPQNPLKKIDEKTGDVTYVYPLTTDKQVMMENGERLNTVLKENILYMGETAEESVAEVINADSVGGYTVPVLMDSFIDKIYPVGSTYVTSTNESPASYLGGSWELVDKRFKETTVTLSTDNITLNTTNCSAISGWAHLYDHHIRVSVNFTPLVALTDSTLEMFTFNTSALGCSQFTTSQVYSGMADGGNVVVVFNVTAAGIFTTRDVIVRGSSETSLATGYSPTLSVEFYASYSKMLDSFCDKFYWKRTA